MSTSTSTSPAPSFPAIIRTLTSIFPHISHPTATNPPQILHPILTTIRLFILTVHVTSIAYICYALGGFVSYPHSDHGGDGGESTRQITPASQHALILTLAFLLERTRVLLVPDTTVRSSTLFPSPAGGVGIGRGIPSGQLPTPPTPRLIHLALRILLTANVCVLGLWDVAQLLGYGVTESGSASSAAGNADPAFAYPVAALELFVAGAMAANIWWDIAHMFAGRSGGNVRGDGESDHGTDKEEDKKPLMGHRHSHGHPFSHNADSHWSATLYATMPKLSTFISLDCLLLMVYLRSQTEEGLQSRTTMYISLSLSLRCIWNVVDMVLGGWFMRRAGLVEGEKEGMGRVLLEEGGEGKMEG